MNGPLKYTVGQSGTLWDPVNMVPLATITVGAPHFATTDDSGNTSANGYFATFTVTVTDIAPTSSGDAISPGITDFYVESGGNQYPSTQTTSGQDLVANLNPGESATGTVTADVPSQHGLLVYAPQGEKPLGAWTF